jgi:hypothetical protein
MPILLHLNLQSASYADINITKWPQEGRPQRKHVASHLQVPSSMPLYAIVYHVEYLMRNNA